jgi:hypothetical protein
MRFALGQSAIAQSVKVKTDAMGRAVHRVNKSQCHRLKAASDLAPSMKLALHH